MCVTLSWSGASASTAASLRLRVARPQHFHHKQQGDASDSEDSYKETAAVTCRSNVDGDDEPTLSIECPSVCRGSSFCVYYPEQARGNCTSKYGSSCYEGDTCTYECLTSAADDASWYITVYDSDETFQTLDAANSAYAVPSVLVNGSVVTKMDSLLQDDAFIQQLIFSGNELGSALMDANGGIDEVYPKGKVVQFTFPTNFLAQLKDLQLIFLQNIVFPATSSKDMPVFPRLTNFYATNTLLEEVPVPARNMPELQELALGYNNIKTIPKGSLSAGLTYLDLSANLLREIPKDVQAMKNLTTLYMSHNPLRDVSNGTIPILFVDSVDFRNCSLNQIPSDIPRMKMLRYLDLSENSFSSSLDTTVLPATLEALYLDSVGLQEIPASFRKLPIMSLVSLSGNPIKEWNVSRLPTQLTDLSIDYCGISSLPQQLKELSSLQTLHAQGNQIREIPPDSLPASLVKLHLSGAELPKISAGLLPLSLATLSIVLSNLSEIPSDLSSMKYLDNLTLYSNNLTLFEPTENLQSLVYIDLGFNLLSKFEARLPAAVKMYVDSNLLQAFNVTKAKNLVSLYLGGNQLTAIPSCIFSMTALLVLDLRDNPIKEYAPTLEEFKFLSSLSSLGMNQTQFSSNCGNQTINLHGYTICSPGSKVGIENNAGDGSKKKSTSVLSIVLNACLVVVLVLVLVAAWHKRKLRQQKLNEMVQKKIAEFKSRESGIWDDEVLLKHRLDHDLVEEVRLISMGMFGEVWLALYKKDYVAVKHLKEKNPDREQIQSFIDEIKLVATFSHPKVVRFVGVVWTKESDLAVLTEYMSNGDLRNYLDNSKKNMDGWDEQMLQIALDITEALVYLHSLEPQLIHRDLKSRNVLFDADMNAKLSDFGVSRYKMDEETMTACVGTIRWVAPEVLAGDRYNESVDIFSLGIILSEIDTHEIPYYDARGEDNETLSDTAIANLVLSGSLTASFSLSCPPEIKALADRCTSHDATQRPSAMQVAYELRQLLRQGRDDSDLSSFTFSSKRQKSKGESVDASSFGANVDESSGTIAV